MKISIIYKRTAQLAAVLGMITLAHSARAADAPTLTPPTNYVWKTTASLGLTLTRGNSDTLLFTAQGLTAKKTPNYELSFGADASYGETSNVKNNENVHGFAQYNRLFSERFYAYLRVDGLHDAIADITYRVTVGPGAGYYFIKNANTTLSAEAGPGYVIERRGGKDDDYITLRLAENFTQKLSDRAKLWQSAEFLPNLEDSNQYIVNAEIGVETGITKSTNLRVYLQDTYNNKPAAGREQNDLKLVSAISWTF
jgi:putative salt-induced outer membrane protein YdiY